MPEDLKSPDLMAPGLEKLSFEDALGELERIVRGLEGGQQKLEDAIVLLRARGGAAPSLRGQARRGGGAGGRHRAARGRHAHDARARPGWDGVSGAWLASPEAERLTALLTETARDTAACIDELIPPVPGREARLVDAMRYATLGGGKRMRAFMVVQVARLFAVSHRCALRVAASVEMLHAYSLVHDDLPAMDDDDLSSRPAVDAPPVRRGDRDPGRRRAADPGLRGAGRPRHAFRPAGARRAGGRTRTGRSGAAGMVGGQTIDIEAERAQAAGETVGLPEVTRLHALKTGRLIQLQRGGGRDPGPGRAPAPPRDRRLRARSRGRVPDRRRRARRDRERGRARQDRRQGRGQRKSDLRQPAGCGTRGRAGALAGGPGGRPPVIVRPRGRPIARARAFITVERRG